MKENKIIAIYARKSKYTGKGESIKNQIDKCQLIINNKYDMFQTKTYIDEGFTGYNTNRPAFKNLINDIKNNSVKTVVVYRLDRISRNVTDFCNLKNILEKYNTTFISVNENFDTSTPLGNAMLIISSVFAQLERDTIAERIKDNMYELAKTGRWLGGNTPLGYASVKTETVDVNGKVRYLYKLTEIPEEIEKVKFIFNKFNELKGIHKLETYLMNNNIKTRNNNYFTRFSLTTILKNPVYVMSDERIKNFFEKKGAKTYIGVENNYGLIAYNKREEKQNKDKEISKWIIASGWHQGIITSELFIKTWNLLEENKNKRFRAPRKNESILSGIIKCHFCDSYMRPRIRKTYNKNKINFSYLCELKDKSRKKLCAARNIDGLTTDRLIIQAISNFKVPKELFLKKLNIRKVNSQGETKNLIKIIKNNELKIKGLIDKLSIIDKEFTQDITNQIKEIKENNLKIKNRIKKLKSKCLDQEKIDNLSKDLIKNFMRNFDKLNLTDRKELVRIIINKVTSDGDNLFITFNDTLMLS